MTPVDETHRRRSPRREAHAPTPPDMPSFRGLECPLPCQDTRGGNRLAFRRARGRPVDHDQVGIAVESDRPRPMPPPLTSRSSHWPPTRVSAAGTRAHGPRRTAARAQGRTATELLGEREPDQRDSMGRGSRTADASGARAGGGTRTVRPATRAGRDTPRAQLFGPRAGATSRQLYRRETAKIRRLRDALARGTIWSSHRVVRGRDPWP